MSDRSLLRRIQTDPVWFFRTVLGFDPIAKQVEVAEAVRDHPRVAVRSAHGVGKTAVAGRIVLWWLAAFPDSVVITTSATWNQVREQLWREIAVGFHASGGFYDGVLTDVRLELGPAHFALGLSTAEPERFAGYHSDRLLVVLDEASGVSEAVWEAAETLTTSPNAHLLAIGNPTRSSGSFYKAFTSERALYRLVHISAFDSPAVTGEPVGERTLGRLVSRRWIDDRRKAWGESSPLWAIRVLGEFAQTSDDTVCSIGAVEAAQARRVAGGDPLVVAADVARYGTDETVIVVRRGLKVRVAAAYQGHDLMRTAGEIVRVARGAQERWLSPVVIGVDDAGVGGGVTDRLRELGMPVRPFLGAGRPYNPLEFPNRRSEAWFAFADWLPLIDLDEDEQLAADLVAPRYSINSRGHRVVEAKDQTKKRLGRSPDRADAVLIAFATRPRGSRPTLSLAPLEAPWLVSEVAPSPGGDGVSLTDDLMERKW